MTARNVAKALPWPKTVGPSEHPPFLTDDRRACKGAPLEWFFADDAVHGPALIAKGRAVCAGCPFNHMTGDGACLAYALRWEGHGIFSGLSAEQRYRMGGVGCGRTTPGVAA